MFDWKLIYRGRIVGRRCHYLGDSLIKKNRLWLKKKNIKRKILLMLSTY